MAKAFLLYMAWGKDILMKKKFVLGLISLLCVGTTCLTSCMKDGVDGKDGINGVDGSAGKDGQDGKDGADGKDGTSIYTGKGAPLSDTGKTGDLYVDSESGDLYSKSESGWIKTGNIKGAQGDTGKQGVSITGVSKTASEDNVDIYTITYSDGSTSTFTVTNGVDGKPGVQGEKGEDGHTPTITVGSNGNWYVDGVDTGYPATGPKGDTGVNGTDGVSIVSVVKTDSNGEIDTYTITYSDGNTSTFTVRNGKDGSDGHTPEVTIGSDGYWYVDGVNTGVKAKGDKGDTGKQGVSITGVSKTASEDNVDIYTITYSDGSTSTFTVTNGVDGKTPYIGENGHWWIGDTDTGVNAKGDKGDTGETGAKGDDGVKGDKGDDGADGKDGVSVVSTYIDENGDLICEMSDGTTINAGHVKDVTKHTVNFYVDDDLVYKTTVEDGGKISAPDDTCLSGYIATSWRSKSDGGFKWLFSVYTVTSDLDLYADDWSAKEYTITLNPGQGALDTKTLTVTYNAQYELPTPTRENYTFLGWYDVSDNKVSSKATWKSTKNITYYAKWTNVQNTYTFDASDGTCDVDSMVIGWEDAYELPTPTVPTSNVDEGLTYYYTFDGWYLNDTLIPLSGTSWSYSNTGGILIAKYTKVDCVKYGIYPQTHVSDETLIATLNTLTTAESNGWYLYDGEYFAEVQATPYATNYKFDDGTTIAHGEYYWFKCDPISWDILESNDGEYKLVSSVLLDAHCYYSSTDSRTIDGKTIYPNNYKYSDIRTWLNDDFYNSAFSLGNSYIQTVEVDNSAATTSYSKNSYACENTNDNVYLLSYQDYMNTQYFADDALRCCKTTDYARARGCFANKDASYLNNGYYWTRSPISDTSDYVNLVIYYVGYVHILGVSYASHGVRPAITVKFE